MFRRHPILGTLGLLLGALLVIVASLLLTFDLNQYRQQLETRLGQSLQRPVSLGGARLRLWQGPAVEFETLRIGPNEQSASTLEADHLRLRLDKMALLRLQIAFRRVLLDGARLSLVFQDGDRGPTLDPASLTRVGINALVIRRGEVQLQDLRDPASPLTLQFSAIEGELDHLALGQKLQLQLTGRLEQAEGPALWTLAGSIGLPSEAISWEQAQLEVQGGLQGLAVTPLLRHALPQFKALALHGGETLRGSCRGEVAGGLQLNLETIGKGVTFVAPPQFRHPRPFPALQLAATWFPTGSAPRWRSLRLTTATLGLAASAELREQEGTPWLQLDVSSASSPLEDWLTYLPDQPAAPALAALRRDGPTGSLRLDRLRYDGPLADLTVPGRIWPNLNGKLTLGNGGWESSPWGELQGLGAELRLEEGWLRLEQGQARLFGGKMTFSGKGKLPWRIETPLQAQAQGELEAVRLLPLLPGNTAEGVSLEGPIPWRGTLAGTSNNLQFGLEADLAALAATRGELALKSAKTAGRLQAQGSLTPERWELSSGRLELPQATLQLQGEKSRLTPGTFRLGLRIDELDLAAWRGQHPLLEKLRAEGRVGLRLSWSGTPEGQQRSGELSIRDGGLQLGTQLAALAKIKGRIRFEPDRATLDPMTALLGTSPIRLQGNLRLGAEPELELQVRAERLRADELIFPSPQAVLRKLDGRLRIDRNGIEFVSARVRLDGGTEATVKGRLEDFSAPRVELEIDGEKVRIEEVIALWRRDPAAPPPAVAVNKPKPLVRIHARARSGSLYGLPFTEADGEITLRNGILTIEPLSFHSGEGYCVAHVAVDPRREGPSLLKISGHAEEFEAASVYQQLLRRKGLVSGALRADFYLEGEIGKTFLATVDGGGSFSVQQGVLRKFQALGKVFSLLNVSQLLTLRLPDMATEGMPFDRLSATLTLRDGILSTEDLFIDSKAMNLSLVGHIDLPRDDLDLLLGVKPLRTVDQIVTRIPIAGWLLAGEEKALITAHFKIRGRSEAPEVSAIPISSLSKQVLGIFQRVLGLPGKLIGDAGELLQPNVPAEKPTGRQ